MELLIALMIIIVMMSHAYIYVKNAGLVIENDEINFETRKHFWFSNILLQKRIKL